MFISDYHNLKSSYSSYSASFKFFLPQFLISKIKINVNKLRP